MEDRVYVKPHFRKRIIKVKPDASDYWERGWKLIEKFAEPSGCRVGEMHATLKEMESIFGKPSTAVSGDGKITTSWTLIFPEERAYIEIYDWKATNKYESGYPSPEEFRNFAKENEYSWQVGSNLSTPKVKKLLEKYFGKKVANMLVRD